MFLVFSTKVNCGWTWLGKVRYEIRITVIITKGYCIHMSPLASSREGQNFRITLSRSKDVAKKFYATRISIHSKSVLWHHSVVSVLMLLSNTSLVSMTANCFRINTILVPRAFSGILKRVALRTRMSQHRITSPQVLLRGSFKLKWQPNPRELPNEFKMASQC